MPDRSPRRPGTAPLDGDELVCFLRSVPQLRDAPDERLRAVAGQLAEAVVPPGHLLVAADERNVLLLLLEGTAEVRGPAGSRVVGPGALVGGDGSWGVTAGAEVRARTPVVAYVVPADRLARCLGGAGTASDQGEH